MSKMTDEEVTEMLSKLRAHFNEPVLPMSRFCDAIRTWASCIESANEDGTKKYAHGSGYVTVLPHVLCDIQKSNLLARLLYLNEPLRTQKCPVHKGHWDGQASLLNGCTYGCNGTGWLRTPELVQKRLTRMRAFYKKTDEEVIEFMKVNRKAPSRTEYQAFEQYRSFCEWVTLIGHGDLVPEEERG